MPSNLPEKMHKRECKPVGHLRFYGSGYGHKTIQKLKVGFNDSRWLLNIVIFDGWCLPPLRVLAKLIINGYVKLELTKSGRDFVERGAKGKIVMHQVRKIKV